MTVVLAFLAALSVALLLWQWIEAVRFPLHRRDAATDFTPAVTVLKPLKGADAETETCLRSWLTQDYAGPVQILFGVGAPDDPACDIVHRLLAEFPRADARLVVCSRPPGPNGKVAKLAELESLAAHDLVVVCDADVRAPRDFLASFVAPFRNPAVGLNSAFYRLATSATAAMRWEALAVNADFWSSVLQARRLGPMRFALGAALALRRATLARAGGFAALMDFLADDYELGRRVAVLGGRVELSPVVVECREAPCGWSEIWRHQLRWARTIRYCQPLPYAFSLLSNPTLWPLLWLVVAPGFPAVVGAGACLTVRLAMAAHCQRRMTRSWSHLPWLWLAPVKDLLGVALWFFAFLGNQVEWRGERLTVRRGGRIVPAA